MTLHSSAAAVLLAFALLTPAAAQDGVVEVGKLMYRTHCFVCHGAEGETVQNVSLKSNQFRRATSDDELSRLILNGVPGTGMPPTNLDESRRFALVAYIRSLKPTVAAVAQTAGDPARGMALFDGKAGCTSCHRIGAKGSVTGPDLTEIGGSRPAAYLQQSILDPNAVIAPQNRYVRAVTNKGAAVQGRRLNEDTHTVQLIDTKQRLVSLEKADLKEYTLIKTSAMPSYKGRLTTAEIDDVASYLLSLKGAQ